MSSGHPEVVPEVGVLPLWGPEPPLEPTHAVGHVLGVSDHKQGARDSRRGHHGGEQLRTLHRLWAGDRATEGSRLRAEMHSPSRPREDSNLEGARSQAAAEPLASECRLDKLRSGLQEAATAAPAHADLMRPTLQRPTVLTGAALKSEVVTKELAGASDAGNMKSAHIPLAVEPPACERKASQAARP